MSDLDKTGCKETHSKEADTDTCEQSSDVEHFDDHACCLDNAANDKDATRHQDGAATAESVGVSSS